MNRWYTTKIDKHQRVKSMKEGEIFCYSLKVKQQDILIGSRKCWNLKNNWRATNEKEDYRSGMWWF